jgi:hypothetical protein
LNRYVSNNVILISSGSLTKEDNEEGSIIKIYSEDSEIKDKILDHIIYTMNSGAYMDIQNKNPLSVSKEIAVNLGLLDFSIKMSLSIINDLKNAK